MLKRTYRAPTQRLSGLGWGVFGGRLYRYPSGVQSSRGSNSVVECNLAKVDVEGSNPFSRSAKKKAPTQGAGPFSLLSVGETVL